MESIELKRKTSNFEIDEEERRSFYLRKTSAVGSGIGSSIGLRRLRKPRCSLAAFSELSLSRSSFRLNNEDERLVK